MRLSLYSFHLIQLGKANEFGLYASMRSLAAYKKATFINS